MKPFLMVLEADWTLESAKTTFKRWDRISNKLRSEPWTNKKKILYYPINQSLGFFVFCHTVYPFLIIYLAMENEIYNLIIYNVSLQINHALHCVMFPFEFV